MFSIVTPTYNRKKKLCRAIDSVIKQTFQDWEMIVVDDGSKDGTQELVESKYKGEDRVRYYKIKNSGANVARNKALREANGDYIMFLDSDDEFKPDYLEAVHKIGEENPTVEIIISKAEFFDGHNVIGTHNIQSKSDQLFAFIKKEIRWLIISGCWRRDFIQTMNGFDEQLKCGQDWDFYLRAILRGAKVFYNENVLARIHLDESDGDRIASVSNKKPALKYFSNVVISRLKHRGKIKPRWKYDVYLILYIAKIWAKATLLEKSYAIKYPQKLVKKWKNYKKQNAL